MRLTMHLGDRLPILKGEIKSDGVPLDLSSATVALYAKSGETVQIDGGACTVTDGPNGKFEYPWADGDTDTAGVYVVTVKVTISGRVQTVPSDEEFVLRVID